MVPRSIIDLASTDAIESRLRMHGVVLSAEGGKVGARRGGSGGGGGRGGRGRDERGREGAEEGETERGEESEERGKIGSYGVTGVCFLCSPVAWAPLPIVLFDLTSLQLA